MTDRVGHIERSDDLRWTISGIDQFHAKVFSGPLLAVGEQVDVVPAELLERAEERLRAYEVAVREILLRVQHADSPSHSPQGRMQAWAILGVEAVDRLRAVLSSQGPSTDSVLRPDPEDVTGTVGAPGFPKGKLRNVIVTLGSHFAKPDNWVTGAWESHLEEVAKQVLLIGRLGRPELGQPESDDAITIKSSQPSTDHTEEER